MKRRLIQVALDWIRPKDPPLSLGHASILANLLKHQVPVHYASWSVNDPTFTPRQAIDFVTSKADAQTDFAIGAFVWNEGHVQSILDGLKNNNFPGRIIIGGPQVSYTKRGLEKFYPQADVFIRGFAENALLKLMQAKNDKPIIKGVHYRDEPDLGLSADVPLEQLPSPFLSGLISPQRFIRWETQRGCPFSCSFCQHRESDDTYFKRRNFSQSRIADEIRWITSNPIIQDIAVLDPTFNSGPYHINTINMLQELGYTGKISLQCRPEMIKPDFFHAITSLNKQARVVLEFGLQTIHKEEQKVIQRPNNLTKVTEVIQQCHREGVEFEVSLIFGLPKQTLSSFKLSVEYCLSLNVPIIHAFPLMLLRGTPLYDLKQQLGLKEDYELASNAIQRLQTNIPHVIESPDFTVQEWKEMAKLAAWLEEHHNIKAAKKEQTFLSKSTSALFHHHKPSVGKQLIVPENLTDTHFARR